MSEGENVTAGCATSLPAIKRHEHETTTPVGRREAVIDEYFREGSGAATAPRRVSTATADLRNISPFPYAPRPGEHFNSSWQTNTWPTEVCERRAPIFCGSSLAAPSIGAPRETQHVWDALSCLL